MRAANHRPSRNLQACPQLARSMPIGLPAFAWMVRIGAPLFLRTDPELALYGRYVVSERVDEVAFVFDFPQLEAALEDLLDFRVGRIIRHIREFDGDVSLSSSKGAITPAEVTLLSGSRSVSCAPSSRNRASTSSLRRRPFPVFRTRRWSR